MENRQRIGWIDVAKGLVILLVVFGHTMRGGFGQRIVYGFHVPAFFFLAGMTSGTDRPLQRIKKDIRRILVPYFCFGLLSYAAFAVLGRFAAGRFGVDIDTALLPNLLGLLYGSAAGTGLRFNTPLWFLPCLFAVKLLSYGLSRICRGRTYLQAGICLILGALGFAYGAMRGPELPFSFSVAVKMLPFFLLGRAFFRRSREREPSLWEFPAGLCLLAVACAVGFAAPKVNYSSDVFPAVPAFLASASLGSLGICLVARGIGRSPVLEYVGRNSLAILLMHKFPVLLLQTLGPLRRPLEAVDSVSGNLWGVFAAAVSVAVTLAAAWAVEKWAPFLLGISRKNEN